MGRRRGGRRLVLRLQGIPHAGRTAYQRAGRPLRTDRGLRPARVAGRAGRHAAQHPDRTGGRSQPARTAFRRAARAAGRLRESRHAPPQRAAGARRRRSRGARGGRAVRPLRPAADRHDVAGAHAAVARRLPERAPRRTALRAGEGRARPHDRIRPQVPRQVPRGAGQGAVRRRFRRAAGLQTPREGRRLPVGLLRIPAGQSGILHLLLPLHGPAGTDGPRRLRRRATASPPASRAPPRALT